MAGLSSLNTLINLTSLKITLSSNEFIFMDGLSELRLNKLKKLDIYIYHNKIKSLVGLS